MSFIEEIVDRIIRDLQSRADLGDVWDEMHPFDQREIRGEWVSIVDGKW